MQYRKRHLALLLIVGFFGCNRDSNEVVGSIDDSKTNANLYDYSLTDINASSDTWRKDIDPSYFGHQVTVHYFGHQN